MAEGARPATRRIAAASTSNLGTAGSRLGSGMLSSLSKLSCIAHPRQCAPAAASCGLALALALSLVAAQCTSASASSGSASAPARSRRPRSWFCSSRARRIRRAVPHDRCPKTCVWLRPHRCCCLTASVESARAKLRLAAHAQADLEILSTTDTHGWLRGHLGANVPEPNSSGDFGDLYSFVSRYRELHAERDVL